MDVIEMKHCYEEPAQKGFGPFAKNRKNILIVDDDETLLHLLKRSFLREGFEVFVARDGIEAMERLRAETPSIVLTDLNMPSLSGLGLIQFIRKNLKDAAIIVMTAYPEEWNGSAVEAFFLKPFDIEEMFSAIQRIVEA
ncbi:MAG: response regulator [Thermodesulfobacteriota bacterium]